MLFPARRLTAALLLAAAPALCLPAGSVQAQCGSHQMSNSFQSPMSQMPAMQFSGMMRMSQSMGMRMGPPAPQMSLMSNFSPMMCMSQSGMSRPMPLPFPMMQTSVLQPIQQQPVVQQLQLVALQQQIAQREQQRITKQQEKLQRIEQLKAIQERMTTLQQQMNMLDRPSQDNPLQAPQLNALQHEVNAVQLRLNGVEKAPQALLEQMTALQDQMDSLQGRVTGKPADLIAVLQQRLK